MKQKCNALKSLGLCPQRMIRFRVGSQIESVVEEVGGEPFRKILEKGTPLHLSQRFLTAAINASHVKVRLKEW